MKKARLTDWHLAAIRKKHDVCRRHGVGSNESIETVRSRRLSMIGFAASMLIGVAGCGGGGTPFAPGTGTPSMHTPTASPSGMPTTAPTQAPTTAPTQMPAGLSVCGNTGILSGPVSPPPGAIVVPAGDDSNVSGLVYPVQNVTYWFAPGTHTLGSSQFSQIIAGPGDTYIGAPGAIIDGQKKNLYAFTAPNGQANVTIEYLTIQNFGPDGANNGAGVVNNGSGSGWTIKYNTIQYNAGAGVYLGSNNVVQFNCLASNGEYGFGSYGPGGSLVTNILFDHNEVAGNNTYNWEAHQPGCGCTGGGKFWYSSGVAFTNNYVHDNHGPGLWADTDNYDFDIESNVFANNDDEGIIYEISYNALIKNNTFIGNAVKYGASLGGFPEGAIYLSESGGDSRVASRYSTITIANNTFTNNWSGVVLWENANRFCNSPDNTSTGWCTLVNPAVTPSTCVAGVINAQPYYSDCRWKTQNVSVTNNVFSFNPAVIPNCTTANDCGMQGMFSNWGTDPSWSPYQADVIEQAITFAQNNTFANNTYVGPWTFMVHDQGTVESPSQWQAAPYNQDAGSTFTP